MNNNIKFNHFISKKGFTLAETLITLVIIGVIAAITIPLLHANYQEQERIAKIRKIYSTLGNAMNLAKINGGSPDLLEVRDDNMTDLKEWFDTFILANINTTKVCYNTKGCWTKNGIKMMNKGNHAYNNKGIGWGHTVISAVLNDGTFICVDPLANGNIWYYYRVKVNNPSGAGLVMAFDINGAKPPNILGKDVFISIFTEDGYVPAYKDASKTERETDCSASGQGFSCLLNYLGR